MKIWENPNVPYTTYTSLTSCKFSFCLGNMFTFIHQNDTSDIVFASVVNLARSLTIRLCSNGGSTKIENMHAPSSTYNPCNVYLIYKWKMPCTKAIQVQTTKLYSEFKLQTAFFGGINLIWNDNGYQCSYLFRALQNHRATKQLLFYIKINKH